MNENRIEDHEILYRVVKRSYPDAFINGKPSGALFIDSNGASVDRDGGRDEKTVVDSLKQRFRKEYKTSVYILAAQCREAGTFPVPNRTKNKYHGEIHESKDEVEISLLKALKLAAICQEVAI